MLKVGSVGFGGPLAVMAFMRDELVDRHKLVTNDRYFEGLAVVKLLPGPVSTLLSIFLGQQICGWVGGVLAGLCYIAPAFAMLLTICLLEDRLKNFRSHGFELAMQAVQVTVVSVVLYTCWKLFNDARQRSYGGARRPVTVTLAALLALVLALLKLPEIAILLACAGAGSLAFHYRRDLLRVDPLTLFFVFFTAGISVFGTGYMVLPHLQRVLVEERAWLNVTDFLNAVAWGNLTPGPIIIASTYMGYKMRGLAGALTATAGIFAAPFLLMLTLGPSLRKVLGRPWIEGVLLGLIPAVAATIVVGLSSLARALPWSAFNGAVLAISLALAFRRWSVVKIFALAALAGGVHSAFAMDNPIEKSRVLADFAVSERPFNAFGGPGHKRVKLPAGKGEGALYWKNSFVAWRGPQSWAGFDRLVVDFYNPTAKLLPIRVEMGDEASVDFATRVNQTIFVPPGPSTIELPLGAGVGEPAQPGRTLKLDAIRSLSFNRNSDSEGEPIYMTHLKLVKLFSAPSDFAIRAFHFGNEISPAFPGMTKATRVTHYERDAGFGFRGAEFCDPYSGANDTQKPDGLYRSSVLIRHGEFVVDLPNGRYEVFLNVDHPGGERGEWPYYRSREIYANDTLVSRDTMDLGSALEKYYFFAHTEDYFRDDVFEKYLSRAFREKTFGVEIKNHQLTVKFQTGDGDPCLAMALSSLVIYPASQSIRGLAYLADVRRLRKQQFSGMFTRDTLSGVGAGARGDVGDPVLFGRDPMDEILQIERPLPIETGRSVSVAAAPGEAVTLSFGVFSPVNYPGAKVALSALRGPGLISPASFRPAWVEYRLARRTYDGSLYTVAERYVRAGDTKALRAGYSARVWSELRVPADAKPGRYTGEITVDFGGGLLKSMPVELRVYAFHLAALDLSVGPRGASIPERAWFPAELRARRRESFLKSLSVMRDYGFNSFSMSPHIPLSVKDGQPRLDFDLVDQLVSQAGAGGFRDLRIEDEVFDSFDLCRDDPKARFGVEAHAFYAQLAQVFERRSQAAHGLPVKVAVCADRWPIFKEWPVFTRAETEEAAEGQTTVSRASLGFGLYRRPDRRSVSLGHWSRNFADPYFALDGREDDDNLCNGDVRGELVCTVALDRHVREGLRDYRYALTLELALKARPECAGRALLQEALRLKLPGEPTPGDVERGEYLRVESLRARIADAIEKCVLPRP